MLIQAQIIDNYLLTIIEFEVLLLHQCNEMSNVWLRQQTSKNDQMEYDIKRNGVELRGPNGGKGFERKVFSFLCSFYLPLTFLYFLLSFPPILCLVVYQLR